MTVEWIEPRWPAPPRVRALTTTRRGGVSRGPYAGLNLGDHVGDEPRAVQENRMLLQRELGLPVQPRWLEQVHGCDVLRREESGDGCRADAAVSGEAGRVSEVKLLTVATDLQSGLGTAPPERERPKRGRCSPPKRYLRQSGSFP